MRSREIKELSEITLVVDTEFSGGMVQEEEYYPRLSIGGFRGAGSYYSVSDSDQAAWFFPLFSVFQLRFQWRCGAIQIARRELQTNSLRMSMADMRSPIVCCLGAAWSECLPLTVAGWTMDNRKGGLRSGRIATMG